MDDRSAQDFPVACRLRVNREYTDTWRRGERCHTPHLIVVAATGMTPSPRLGITVSRKVGNAVCRNRIKRWIREFFRCQRERLVAAVDISVIAKPGAATLGHRALENELQEAFQRLRVTKNA